MNKILSLVLLFATMMLASCSKDDEQTVTVTLDPTTLSLTVGEAKPLIATVLPENVADKTVTWSSDKEAVATVIDGIVTGVSEGTTTITATSVSDKSKEVTCVITVIKKASMAIGDYYYENGTYSPDFTTTSTCIGIVVAPGFILSDRLSGSYAWSTENVEVGATDKEDGRVNVATVKAIDPSLSKYPAFQACETYEVGGKDWYLPAQKDFDFYSNRSLLSGKFKAAGMAELNEEFLWTSIEYSTKGVTDAYSKYQSGFISQTSKSKSHPVRCLKVVAQ